MLLPQCRTREFGQVWKVDLNDHYGRTEAHPHGGAAFGRTRSVAPVGASFGLTIGNRLNRRGDGRACQALLRIAMFVKPRTRAYVARRTADEGRSKRESSSLKRCGARDLDRCHARVQ